VGKLQNVNENILLVVSAFVYIVSSNLLVKLHVDDPLNASPVHLFCGGWGVLSVGLFADEDFVKELYGGSAYGLFVGGGFGQIWVQLVGMLAVSLWSAAIAFVIFWILNSRNLLRVDAETELAGLDNTKHGGSAYPYFQTL
jgi:Amt family ammonium transporter